ncbi:hypothetical protein Bp8pS_003 [Bacillus phage vB_BpuM-BpSp]|nr:hypothetical protein Bp8pS_003 [Bacillus phage vB_BpuM-BpSp]
MELLEILKNNYRKDKSIKFSVSGKKYRITDVIEATTEFSNKLLVLNNEKLVSVKVYQIDDTIFVEILIGEDKIIEE